jgi:dolichyl-phosphate beta-glucosyltransferase
MSAIGIVLLALLYPSQVRQHAPHALRAFGWAALFCVPLVIYPLLYGALEVNGYVGSAHGTYAFQADLLGSLVPNGNFLVAPHGLVTIGNRFILGDIVENGSYLGIPLLIVLVGFCVRWWRLGFVRFAALMVVAAWLLSLGPRLTIDTHESSIRLPFDVLEHLPGFVSLEAARFSLFEDLFVAVILAFGLDQLGQWWTRTRAGDRRVSSRTTGILLTLVCAFVAFPLIPRWPHQEFATSTPSFFSSRAAQQIPQGSVTLTYPYPDTPNLQGMLWQAADGMKFRLMGGYAVVPGAGRVASFNPFPPDLQMVPATLVGDYLGQAPSQVVAGSSRASAGQVRSFLRHYRVQSIVAQHVGAHPDAAYALIESALGAAPRHQGGVDVWLHVPADVKKATTARG